MGFLTFCCIGAFIASSCCLYATYKTTKKEAEFADALSKREAEFENALIKREAEFESTLSKREDIYHETVKSVYGSYVEEIINTSSSYSKRIDDLVASQSILSKQVEELINSAKILDRRIKVFEEDLEKKKDQLVNTIKEELEKIDSMDGQSFEKWCANLLVENGFRSVELTPTSGDQGIDILAEKNGVKYGIQCKCYSSLLGNSPVQEAYAGKAVYNCNVAIVMTNSYFTNGGIEAAKKTNTVLWDRDMLKRMIFDAHNK